METLRWRDLNRYDTFLVVFAIVMITGFSSSSSSWNSTQTVVGATIQATKVGAIKRSDGAFQATYNNAPLYRYVQ